MSSIGLGGLGRQTDRPKLIADYSKSFLKDLPTNFLTSLSTSSYKLPHIFLQISSPLCLHLPTNCLTSSYIYSIYIFLQISSSLSPHLLFVPTTLTLIQGRICSVELALQSADTAVCVRGEVSLSDRTLPHIFLQLSSPLSPYLPTNFLTSSYNFLHLSIYIFLQLSPSSAHGRHTLNYIYEL